jgi:hypothetical protein
LRRRVVGFIASAALLVPLVGGVGISRADVSADHNPSQWPTAPSVTPNIDATAYSYRIWGADRSQTNFAAELTLRGTKAGDTFEWTNNAEGMYPFGTSDRTTGNATSLASAGSWWGPHGCPEAIIVSARDKFPDSLAASDLLDVRDTRDGQGWSSPRGSRMVKAKNLASGMTDNVDTVGAPIIITSSSREGATSLSPTAARAAHDVMDFRCENFSSDSFDAPGPVAAIIVGREAAVPTGVEGELQAMGYQTYRLGGADRFETAKLIAFAAGTGAPVGTGETCRTSDTTKGHVRLTTHELAAPEYRKDAKTCAVLDQTVALADGITGADALSVGWASSYFGFPILLTGPGGSLPTSTQSALQTLSIKHIIVLGGTARIPAATATQAATLAGVPAANVVRIAGADRYASSVEMAKSLGGWFPTGGTDFRKDMACLAASGGEGDNGQGWPDALAASAWCGTANFAQADGNPQAPGDMPAGEDDFGISQPIGKVLTPANGKEPLLTPGPDDSDTDSWPGHDAVPILLVPPGASTLASPVSTFLGEAFPATPTAGVWCTSNNSSSCSDPVDPDNPANVPGFAIAFGGTAVIADGALRQAATLVSGGTYTTFSDLTPSLGTGFYTQLNMAPVFWTLPGNDSVGDLEGTTVNNACFARDLIKDVHYLSVYDDAGRTIFDSQYDVIENDNDGTGNNSGSIYVSDADKTGVTYNARSKGKSSPSCVKFDDAEAPAAAKGISSVSGMSISGHFTPAQVLNYTATKLLNAMTAQAASPPASYSGFDATQDDNPASAGMPFGESYSPTPTGSVFIKNVTCSITGPGEVVSVNVTRGASTTGAPDIDTFTASFTIPTSCGNLTGTAAGEAILQTSTSGASDPVGDRCSATPDTNHLVWRLRGQATFTGATFAGTGGFTADVDTMNTSAFTDDAICKVAVDGLSA